MTFDVDHSKLEPGIYINGSKVVGDKEIITYDIRICRPYQDKVLSNVEMHSIEHIMATYLEDEVSRFEGFDRIYFGPMGCQTGFYLLMASPISEVEPEKKVLQMIRNACTRALGTKEVPFTDAKQCGNNRTLAYNHEVEGVLKFIHYLSDGIKKYTYIKEEPNVVAHYVVAFGPIKVVVETDVVSYEEICELAKDSCPRKFITNFKQLVRERKESLK